MRPSSGNSTAPNDSELEAARVAAAETAFQDAVYDLFIRGRKPNEKERARLRDLLADACCPKEIVDALMAGTAQLDTTEFLNYFLELVMPEKSRVNVTSKVEWKAGAQTKTSLNGVKEAKLEFDLPDEVGAVDLSKMLENYQREEKLNGENKFDAPEGKVDAKKNLRIKATNADAEIVISLKRFKYTDRPGLSPVKKKIESPVSLDNISLPLQDDDTEKMQEYCVTSFIVHEGGLDGGHYVAYVKESDKKWYCYNDRSKTEVSGDDLIEAKTQAYVVKYSPLNEGECTLPQSQGDNGTANGGNRCWANAAFAFALSMTSLHDEDHKRSEEKALPEVSLPRMGKSPEVVECVKNILHYDGGSDLKSVLEMLRDIRPGVRKSLDDCLKEISAVSIRKLLENTAQNYLLELAPRRNQEKTKEILSLREFFSDEKNRKNILNIIDQIADNQAGFIENPLEFCARVINPSDLEKAKKELKSKSPQFSTSADLCYTAIIENDAKNLKKFLPNAIAQDENFLTNALCFAVTDEKADIANLLIADHEANQDKKSSLYGKTAKEIDDERIGKKILSPESKPEDEVAPPVLFDRWKISYPAKFETSETGEYFRKAKNNFFEAFEIMPLGQGSLLKSLKKISAATVDLAFSIAWGLLEYLPAAVINTITSPIRTEVEIKKKVKNSERATVEVQAGEEDVSDVDGPDFTAPGSPPLAIIPGSAVKGPKADQLKQKGHFVATIS